MTQRALIADSDLTTRDQIAAVLIRYGFAVECADDGDRALARMVAALPTVVVCSEALSGLSGVELTYQIRSLGSRSRIVLLFGVELPSDQREQLSERIGCDAILCRPFRVDALDDLLTQWGLMPSEPTGATAGAGPVPFAIPAVPPLRPIPTPPPATAPDSAAAPLVSGPIPMPLSSSKVSPATSTTAPSSAAGPSVSLPSAAPAPPIMGPPPPAPAAQQTDSTPPPPGPPPLATTEGARPATASLAAPGDAPPLNAAGGVPSLASVPPLAPLTAAPRLLPCGVARVGSLSTLPLPRLIYELYVGTYFGILHLERREARRSIYFWAGLPVRVDSEQLTDSLGVLLRDAGRITEAQYAQARQLAITHNVALGAALVELNLIHERELLETLSHQTEQKLVSTFAWRDGNYRLVDDTTFATGTCLSEVHPLKAISRGVREHYDIAALLDYFSMLRAKFVVVTDLFAVQRVALDLPLQQLELTTVLNGHTTFEQALLSNTALSVEMTQALYVFLVTDMIRPTDEPGEPWIVDTSTDSTPAQSILVEYDKLLETSERIAREYFRIKGGDHFAALQLEPNATTDFVDDAYRRAMAVLEADMARPGLPPEDIRRAREIATILTEAHNVLFDSRRRALYRAGLASTDARTDSRPTETAYPHPPTATTPARRAALFNAEQEYKEGLRLLTAGDQVSARRHFDLAIEINPDEATYRVGLAQALLAGPHPGLSFPRTVAFDCIDEALRLDPANLLANLEAARLLIEDNLPDQARTYLERILQRAPEHRLALRLLETLPYSTT